MHQITIDAQCHQIHYLYRDGAPPTLEAVARDFTSQNGNEFGLACSICDYGNEDLSRPGLVAFYVEQVEG